MSHHERLRIGVVLPNTHPTLARPDLLLQAGEHADRAGYDSIWLNDHLVMPAGSIEANAVRQQYAGNEVLDPFVMMGALAASTERVTIGISVLVLPYRHPLLVAKMLTTADITSGGRTILGVGSGWMKEQFDALGVSFENRGAITDDYLAALIAAGSSGEPTYEGTYARFSGIRLAPESLQRPVPIWVGGRTRRAGRRAIEHGLPWHPSHWSLAQLEAEQAWLRQTADRLGRPCPPLTMRLKWSGGADNAPEDHLPGSADAAAEHLARLEALGVTHLVVEIPSPSGEQLVDNIDAFATTVLHAWKENRA
jgi:probable F420-dependent oxidoreductase